MLVVCDCCRYVWSWNLIIVYSSLCNFKWNKKQQRLPKYLFLFYCFKLNVLFPLSFTTIHFLRIFVIVNSKFHRGLYYTLETNLQMIIIQIFKIKSSQLIYWNPHMLVGLHLAGIFRIIDSRYAGYTRHEFIFIASCVSLILFDHLTKVTSWRYHTYISRFC